MSDETEVITPEKQELSEARSALAIHERREAMDASLDIVATQTKLEAKEAIKKAQKEVDRIGARHTEACEKERKLVREFAWDKFCNLPIVAKIIEVIAYMSDVQFDAQQLWEPHELTLYERPKQGHWRITVHSHVYFDIEVNLDDNTTKKAECDRICLDVGFDEAPGLMDIRKEIDSIYGELEDAKKILELCEERKANLKDQVEVARVQLQRQKLTSMGANGREVLAKVEEVLAASTGGNYLELL